MFFILKDLAGEFKTDLPEVAIDLLCSPANQTPLERLFSCAGFLSQNRSARITASLEHRCLIKANKSFL